MADEDWSAAPPDERLELPDPYPDFWAGTGPQTSTASASDAQPANAQVAPPLEGGRSRGGGVYVSDSRPAQVEPPPQRIIHDVPPVWDGRNPDNELEPDLKLLAGWLSTTRTRKPRGG